MTVEMLRREIVEILTPWSEPGFFGHSLSGLVQGVEIETGAPRDDIATVIAGLLDAGLIEMKTSTHGYDYVRLIQPGQESVVLGEAQHEELPVSGPAGREATATTMLIDPRRAAALRAVEQHINEGPTDHVATVLDCVEDEATDLLESLETEGLVTSQRYKMDAGRYIRVCWRPVHPQQISLF